MKRAEIAMIILIASFSMMLTFFIAQSVLGDKVKREKKVQTIDAVQDLLVEPSKLIFNEKAINPTVEVHVQNDIKAAAGASVGGLGISPADRSKEATEEAADPTVTAAPVERPN